MQKPYKNLHYLTLNDSALRG